MLHWDVEYLARQRPVLPARDGYPRKVKPLVRIAERERAAYCVVKGIDYIVEECPMAAGNRHLEYKAVLNSLEATSPGSKHAFYHGFLERLAPLMAGSTLAEQGALEACERCGAPTPSGVCAFCHLLERTAGHDTVPVRAPRRRSR